jgi:CheY-like chemotaxis protein
MSLRPNEADPGRRPLRVLIVEDSADDAELVLRKLRRGGFEPSLERVETAEDFAAALQREWDVILSDFSMPRFNAFGALELLEGRRDSPRSSSSLARSAKTRPSPRSRLVRPTTL